eukprot:scaffold59889_cov45-Attheya_sp.AAC.1
MIVPEADCWHFAYVLPDAPGEPIRLVIPHALQMGWTQSPGFFSAVTETVRDSVQVLMEESSQLPPPCYGKLHDSRASSKTPVTVRNYLANVRRVCG